MEPYRESTSDRHLIIREDHSLFGQESANDHDLPNSTSRVNQLAVFSILPNYGTIASISSTCLSTIGSLAYIPHNVVSLFYDYFIDGNKPWKQIKYLLSLKAIVTNFETKNKPLDQIKTVFSEYEKTPAQNAILVLIDALLQDNENSLDKCRTNYRYVIDCLRNALEFKTADFEYTPFLETVCLYRYTELHLFLFCEALIQHIIKVGIKEIHQGNPEKIQEESLKELHQIPLNEQFLYINAAPQNEKAPISHLYINLIPGGCNLNFDPQRGNNIPYALFDFLLNEKSIRVLRAGTPTIQRNDYQSLNYQGQAQITPEFQCLIEGLASNNKKLLYISLQNNQERYLASEKARNSALISLHEQFSKTFQLVILAHDSPFYHQKDSFENMSDAYEFKQQFLKEMLSKDSGFFFPDNLQDSEFFQIVMDEVHEDLYLNADQLTKIERLDFIEYFYTRLTLHLLKESKVDYLINSCKDSIDRAGIRNALLQYLLLVFYQKEKSESHLNELFIFLHAGAFLVKKRAVNFRHERLLSILKLLESDEIRKRIYQRREDVAIEGDDLKIEVVAFGEQNQLSTS